MKPMLPTSSLDPFNTAKQEVIQKLDVVTALYELYQEEKQKMTGEHSITDLTTELRQQCKVVEYHLNNLEKTVQIVEKQPSRFGISQTELHERKEFIQNTKNHIKQIKNEIDIRKVKKEDRKNLLKHDQFEDEPVQSAYTRQIQRDNQDFIQLQLEEQQRIKSQQDLGLERAIESVDRIHTIAKDINDELDTQNKELGEMEHEVEQTTSLLKRTTHRMEKLMSIGGDTGKIICIIILIVVIVLMVVLLFGI
jgi:chromosome segregation ATPase